MATAVKTVKIVEKIVKEEVETGGIVLTLSKAEAEHICSVLGCLVGPYIDTEANNAIWTALNKAKVKYMNYSPTEIKPR